MLTQLENNFSQLEKRIQKMHKAHQDLLEKYEDLSKELEQMKEDYNDERKKNRVLAEEQKELKLYSAISGNADHNRLMKNHINRLVKEIDFCIAELQNSGL
ncbi:hypothetical protein [Chryseobacterium sp. T1]